VLIIYISGIDGCGKTTQSKLLVEALKKRGLDSEYVWLRWEPSFKKVFRFFNSLITRDRIKEGMGNGIIENENIKYSEWYNFKRKILLNQFVRELWWYHACADYYYSLRKRFRNLYSKVIVVDRYVDDFIIDQAINFGVASENCNKLANNIFIKRFKSPDLKIIMDLPAIVGYTRKQDGTPLNYLKQREAYYKGLPASDTTVHLNGLEDIPFLSRQIEKYAISALTIG